MNKQRKYTQILPDFIPYRCLKIGNNKIGVKYILNISGFFPILIGSGEVPQIWIFMRIGNVITPLVEKNISKTPQVKSYISDNKISFSVYDIDRKSWKVLIHVRFEHKDEPYIDLLDLRPIGISLFLDDDKLNIGNIVLNNNTITGSETLVGVD